MSGIISGSSSNLNSFSVAQGNSGRGGKVTLEAGSSISGLTINTVASGGLSGDVEVRGVGNLLIANTQILTAQQIEVCLSSPCSSSSNPPRTISLNNKGQAGNVTITSPGSLTFSNSEIQSDTRGGKPAGNINFSANQGIKLTDGSLIAAQTSSGGRAGSISFNAPTLVVAGDAQVLAETSGSGSGGSIFVNAPISVDLSRTNNLSPVLSVQTSGAGKAGDIVINTPNLTLADQSRITATATATSTNLQGGGSVTLNASTMNLAGSAGVFAETQGLAPAGTLRLNPYNNQPDLNITLTPSSQISASTSGSGHGGDLILTAPRSITLTGPGELAVKASSNGNAGSINISTGNLTLTNGVEVTASTSGSGKAGDLGQGNAGNVVINARTLFLDRGTLDAMTASSDGGNISLQVGDLLLLRHGSLISTTAGTAQAGGDGGNITIATPFIVAVPKENSDITANAYTGKGGRIDITTQGIFGTQFRPHLTPLSDITASSQFGVNGTVQINTPGIDPSQGLTDLPTIPTDASKQIAQGCYPGNAVASQQNQFVITGRGGLPPNPREALSNDAVDVGWVMLNPQSAKGASAATSVSPDLTPATPTIVEAQRWVYGPHGEVILTATPPTLTPQNAGLKPPTCPQL